MMATVKILIEGFAGRESEEKTCPTITLVRDGGLVIVIDPGVLDSQQILIDRLKEESLNVEDVNLVCITHSHIDHYRNIGMFPNARVLEYFGIWDGGVCSDWNEEFTPNIQILKTPGHDYTSITLFVKTEDGIVAICGDVFWKEDYPEFDEYAIDQNELEKSRRVVLEMADWIVPGHAGMYKARKFKTSMKKEFIKKGERQSLGFCRKCHAPFIRMEDKCDCRPYLCYRCCMCDMDCNLCSCKHKR